MARLALAGTQCECPARFSRFRPFHHAKDLASLIGKDQKWLNTQSFLDKIDSNPKMATGSKAA